MALVSRLTPRRVKEGRLGWVHGQNLADDVVLKSGIVISGPASELRRSLILFQRNRLRLDSERSRNDLSR